MQQHGFTKVRQVFPCGETVTNIAANEILSRGEIMRSFFTAKWKALRLKLFWRNAVEKIGLALLL